jgi:hypothetical protein
MPAHSKVSTCTFKLKAGSLGLAARLLAFKLPAVCWRHGPQAASVRALRPTSDGRRARHFRPIQVAPFFLRLLVSVTGPGRFKLQRPASGWPGVVGLV